MWIDTHEAISAMKKILQIFAHFGLKFVLEEALNGIFDQNVFYKSFLYFQMSQEFEESKLKFKNCPKMKASNEHKQEIRQEVQGS